MTEPVLRADRDGAVLVLTLNRPAKRNALSAELRDALVAELGAGADDHDVGAVLLTAAGDHFCAGFDLDEIASADDPAAVFAHANAYHHHVHTFPKPIVAAVRGTAVAGGLDLALMCDIRMAATSARFGQPQVKHGIPAAFELTASVVGDAAARDLCLTGRVVDSSEALRIGLVHQVVDDQALAAAALELATTIAGMPAAAATKKAALARQPQIFPTNG